MRSLESDTPRTEINVVWTYPDGDLDEGRGLGRKNGRSWLFAH